MALSISVLASAQETSNSTTGTVTFSSGDVTSGNLLFAVLTLDGSQTVTGPSGWTRLNGIDIGSGNCEVEFWYKKALTADETATSYQWTIPSSEVWHLLVYQAVDATTIPVLLTSATGSSSSPATTSQTANDASSISIAGFGASENVIPSSLDATVTTEDYSNGISGTPVAQKVTQVVGHWEEGDTGIPALTHTTNYSTDWGAFVVEIKPAVAAGGVYPVEEALLREPNLWVPGKKPVGNVKINWRHSLTKGLQSFVLASQNQPQDLVTGQLPNEASGTWGIKKNGQVFTTDQGADQRLKYPYDKKRNIAGLVNFTFMWYGVGGTPLRANQLLISNRSGALGTDGEYLIYAKDSTNQPITMIYKSNAVTNTLNGVVSWPENSAEQELFLMVRNKNSGSWTVKLNEQTQDVTYTNNLPVNADVAQDYSINNDITNAVSSVGASVYFTAQWARDISDAEYYEMCKNPYQFLIPA